MGFNRLLQIGIGVLLVAVIGLAIYYFVGFDGSGETEAPTDAADVQVITLESVAIAEWEGDGDMTTESFTVTNSPWVIAWGVSPAAPSDGVYSNSFSIAVMRAGGDSPEVVPVMHVDLEDRSSGTAQIQEAGTFYLEVTAANAAWTVTVYDYRQ